MSEKKSKERWMEGIKEERKGGKEELKEGKKEGWEGKRGAGK